MEKNNAKQIVLVHGSCHGSWTWYKVATLLKSVGHRIAVMDLGASGIHSKQLHEIPTLSGYLEPLMEFMGALPPEEKVVLVGHSYGGIAISVAAERFPINVAAAVYVSAFMPAPGFDLIQFNQQIFDLEPDSKGGRFSSDPNAFQDSIFTPHGRGSTSVLFGSEFLSSVMYQLSPPEIFDLEPDSKGGRFSSDPNAFQDSIFTPHGRGSTSVLFGSEFLSSVMYQLSPPEDLMLANLLKRPFPIYRDEKSSKEAKLTEENYGSIRRIYIVSKGDMIITEEIQKGYIINYPPHDVKEMDGSDHMVMFSQPQELSSLLQLIAQLN